MTRAKSTTIALVFALLSFVLFTFRIDTSLIYHPDFARDLYEILKITQGNLTLLGPKLSFGGLYSGPYYYYLFVPIFSLTGGNMIAIPVFNAFLFSCAIGYFAKKTIEKYGVWKGLLATVCLSLITLMVFAARSPHNGNTYVAFLLVFLTYIQFEKIYKRSIVGTLGFLFGVIVNITFAALTLLPSMLLLMYVHIHKKRDLLLFIAGIVLSFMPLALFEIKNNFIMLKNTFIDKSYLAWIKNENVIKGAGGNKNIFKNLLFITGAGQMQTTISIHPLLAYALMITIYIKEKNLTQKLLIVNTGIALFVVTFLTRYQFAQHYLYPVGFFLFFGLLIVLLESRYSFLLGVLAIVVILTFPTRLYKQSTVPAEPFERAVQFSITHKLIDKTSHFNVAYIAAPNAILGYEFRYFFQKYGYPPLSEFAYGDSDTLLLFTQKNTFDPSQHNTWETQQFGRQYLVNTQQYHVGTFTIYKAKK